MTATSTTAVDDELASRASAGYARLYAAVAVFLVGLLFFPPFEDVTHDDVTTRFGGLFDMAGRDGGQAARLGLTLLGGLVVLLLFATFRVRSAMLPAWIAALAAVAALMLISRPNTGNPKPPLAPAGQGGLTLLIATALLALAHAIHLTVLRRRAQ
jgi:hypothetical protein